MEIRRSLLPNLFTGILVLCAVIVTTLTVRQYLVSRQGAEVAPKHISDWAGLISHRSVNIGSNSAPLKIIEFSDYQCPYCRELEPNLQKLVEEKHGAIAVVRYDYPLKIIHQYAYKAAIASKCAEAQGVYEPYETELFQGDLAKADWVGIAKRTHVANLSDFSKCLDTNATGKLVDADVKTADQIGIKETPTLVINGNVHPGMETSDDLDNLISRNR